MVITGPVQQVVHREIVTCAGTRVEDLTIFDYSALRERCPGRTPERTLAESSPVPAVGAGQPLSLF